MRCLSCQGSLYFATLITRVEELVCLTSSVRHAIHAYTIHMSLDYIYIYIYTYIDLSISTYIYIYTLIDIYSYTYTRVPDGCATGPLRKGCIGLGMCVT